MVNSHRSVPAALIGGELEDSAQGQVTGLIAASGSISEISGLCIETREGEKQNAPQSNPTGRHLVSRQRWATEPQRDALYTDWSRS